MKKNKSDYSIVTLSKYTAPEIKEVRNKEWIEYGKDNNYFKYLIDRFIGSATNNAIINGIVNQIYGKGISALDAQRRPEQYAQMLSLFKKDDLKRFIKDRKMLGMAAFQVTYEKGQVKQVSHFPINTLRAEKANKDGEIEAWYYHPDWDDIKISDKPLRISSFDFGKKKGNEIIVLKPYVAGYEYYSPVDYVGALPYAVLEEEIGDYLINDTLNGFSGTKVVNFNNGVPDDKEKMLQIKRDVLGKLTGARGEKVIIAFNSNKESATTVKDLPLNDAPAHYKYLSKECRDKLIVGHRVTSPMLIGVRETGGGLGNNADEIKTASLLFDNITINFYQDEVTDIMDKILSVNEISLKLYFKSLQPLDFQTPEQQVQMSKDKEIADKLIAMGEDSLGDEWILIDERDVDYENEQFYDQELAELNEEKPSLLSKIRNLVSTGVARPNSKSEQDKEIKGVKYKVRYSYNPNRTSEDSREFCKKMVSANKLYRKEDIKKMDNSVVNAGWGKGGADKYSIWKYKGGAACHHRWRRKTFANKINVDVNNPKAKTIGTRAAEIDGFKVTNDWQVSVRPVDMPNKGFIKKRG